MKVLDGAQFLNVLKHQALDSHWKRLLSILFKVLSILLVLKLASMVYGLVVLFGVSLILTYLLLLPVNTIEALIVRVTRQTSDAVGQDLEAGQDSGEIAQDARPLGWLKRTPRAQPRILSVILVYVLFFTMLLVGSVKVLPLFVHQVEGFSKALPVYLSQMQEEVLGWSSTSIGAEALKKVFHADIEKAKREGILDSSSPVASITPAEKQVIQLSFYEKVSEQIVQLLESGVATAIENIGLLLSRSVRAVIYLLSCLVIVFYLLLDGRQITKRFEGFFPEEVLPKVRYFLERFHQIMFSFVKGQILLAFVSGLLMYVLYTVFQVKYAIFLSAFFTVAEILPVVGPWIAFTPGFLVMLFSEQPWVAPCVWGLYVMIKDNIILPKVVGELMGLHPVVVIISLLFCAKLGGLLGVLLAIPLASFLKVLLEYYVKEKNRLQSQLVVKGSSSRGEECSL